MPTTTKRSKFLAACLRDLEAAGIPFCISRNHGQFWKDGASDVDMIVQPEFCEKAARVIGTAAQGNGYRLALRTRFDNLCLTFHAPGAHFVRIDIDTAVRWRNRTLASASEILDRRIKVDMLPAPAPEHEILILLCQCAWSGKVKPAYRERILSLIKERGETCESSDLLMTRFGFGATNFSELLASGSTAMLRSAFTTGTDQNRVANFFRFFSRTLCRASRPPGMVVIASEMDREFIDLVSGQLELLFPIGKSTRPSDPALSSFFSAFRGGICWGKPPIFLSSWVGKAKIFSIENGTITNLASGLSSPANGAADLIGNTFVELSFLHQ